jgi:hypothetical protein
MADIFSVATAVLASLGGAGLLLIALSSWLGKVWASRILERERADLAKSIETTKYELTLSIEHEKHLWQRFSNNIEVNYRTYRAIAWTH